VPRRVAWALSGKLDDVADPARYVRPNDHTVTDNSADMAGSSPIKRNENDAADVEIRN
jgi:hypothetical protein